MRRIGGKKPAAGSVVLGLALAGFSSAGSAEPSVPLAAGGGSAAEPPAPAADAARDGLPVADEQPDEGSCQSLCYVHTFVDVGAGKALRFNNPFRLQTQLGDSPESLSATATTLDLKLGAVVGDPFSWHHGLSVSIAIAVEGVPQQVITPAYQFAVPLGTYVWWRGHLGPAIVTQPSGNVGLEAGTQLLGMIRAGIAPYLGLVYAQYWGAATDRTQATVIPLLGAQLGVSVMYEVLP